MSTQKQEVASKCESAHCELLATRNGTEGKNNQANCSNLLKKEPLVLFSVKERK